VRFNFRAVAKSLPNGFSHTTRAHLPAGADSASGSQLLQHHGEEFRCSGQIEKTVRRRAALGIELIQQRLQRGIALGIRELAAMVVNGRAERRPKLGIVALARELLVPFLQLRAEALIRFLTAGEADHLELRRQIAGGRQVVERRDQLARGQVARRAKDHHGARLRTLARDERVEKGIVESFRHEGGGN